MSLLFHVGSACLSILGFCGLFRPPNVKWLHVVLRAKTMAAWTRPLLEMWLDACQAIKASPKNIYSRWIIQFKKLHVVVKHGRNEHVLLICVVIINGCIEFCLTVFDSKVFILHHLIQGQIFTVRSICWLFSMWIKEFKLTFVSKWWRFGSSLNAVLQCCQVVTFSVTLHLHNEVCAFLFSLSTFESSLESTLLIDTWKWSH